MFRYLVLFLWVLAFSLYASLTHATLDAVFASYEPSQVCLGDGTGRFTCSDVSADTSNSFSVALGYINGDTFLDAVFANSPSNQVCLGDGTGRFTCSDVSADTNNSSGVALGDVNSDTFLDAVFANPFGPNQVCLVDGTGSFTCSDISDSINPYHPSHIALGRDVALGNMNGDVFPDAVFANYSFDQRNRICLGDGTGCFTCSDVSADTKLSLGVALGDVNGDTFLDAVFANDGLNFGRWIDNAENRICLGDGTGSFTCSDVSVDSSRSEDVALGDVNNDTFLDAVFANRFVPNQVCLGDGTGSFTCSDVSADTDRSLGVALGDANGDTFLDAVFANAFSEQPNRICLGDGTGSFTCSDVSDNTSRGVALGEVDQAIVIAAVLPSSRSVQVDDTATAFATITNASEVTANDCGISPVTSVTANFTYQTTDPVTNAPTGMPDTPVDIAPGQSQSFVFAFAPTAAFPSTEIQLSFDCSNADPAPIITGVNTLLLSASATAVPDIVALAATPSNDGIVNITGTTGTGVLAVATVNVGVDGQITATADTGGFSLSLSLSICQTDPATSICLSEPGDAAISTIAGSTTSSFAIFVAGAGNVPFDPANNRIFVRFRDSGDITRGSTSVAVRTQ